MSIADHLAAQEAARVANRRRIWREAQQRHRERFPRQRLPKDRIVEAARKAARARWGS